jgi:hypothetical protein
MADICTQAKVHPVQIRIWCVIQRRLVGHLEEANLEQAEQDIFDNKDRSHD